MNIMEKLIKTVILGMSLTLLTFSLHAKRNGFDGDLYPKTIQLSLDDVDEVGFKEELRKIGPKLEVLDISSDELKMLDFANLEYLKNITIDSPYLTGINVRNCESLLEFCFSGFIFWPQSVKINNCPLLQLISITDSDINDQQLKQLLLQVKDSLVFLSLSSCENLQDIDLKMYPKLELLSFANCPGLQRNIKKLRATGVEIETFE